MPSLITKSVTFALLIWINVDATANDVDADPVDVNEVIERLVHWRASILELRVVYESRSLPETLEPVVEWSFPPPAPESAHQWSHDEWIWSEFGVEYSDSRSFYWTPGANAVRHVQSFHGDLGVEFKAQYRRPPGEAEQLKHLTRRNWDPLPGMTRLPLHAPTWLRESMNPEKLLESTWTLEGFEEVCGTRSETRLRAPTTERTFDHREANQSLGLYHRRDATTARGNLVPKTKPNAAQRSPLSKPIVCRY